MYFTCKNIQLHKKKKKNLNFFPLEIFRFFFLIVCIQTVQVLNLNKNFQKNKI